MANQNTKKEETVGEIEFFGKPDRNIKGGISSSIPAWMLPQFVEELQESVGRKKRALEHGLLPPESIPYAKEEMQREQERLDEILNSKPVLSGAQQDAVARERESLKRQIIDSMPTLRDDRNGFVRPHDEYRRTKERHITIDPKMAAGLGIKPEGGKITGDQAARAYNILSAALGEDGSTERLRRDWGQPSYRTEDPLTQEILRNGR